MRDDAGRTRMLTELAARDSQDVALRKALYAIALRDDDAGVRARWREELKPAEGPNGKSAVILDALHEARGGATVPDRKLGDWHDLARGVLSTTPDHADAHLLLAVVAEARHDAVEAAKEFD